MARRLASKSADDEAIMPEMISGTPSFVFHEKKETQKVVLNLHAKYIPEGYIKCYGGVNDGKTRCFSDEKLNSTYF